MLQKQTGAYSTKRVRASADRSLQIVLWTLWTLLVAGTALFRWYADITDNRPLDLLGLAIYSTLAGLAGLLIITLIELRTDPEKFLD